MSKKQNKNILYKTTAKNFTKLNLLAYSIYNNIWFAFTHSLLVFCVAHREEATRISSCRRLCSANSSEGRFSFRALGCLLMCQRSWCEIADWLSFVFPPAHFIAAVSFLPWVWIEDKTEDINSRNSAKGRFNNNKVFLSHFPQVAKLGVSASVI